MQTELDLTGYLYSEPRNVFEDWVYIKMSPWGTPLVAQRLRLHAPTSHKVQLKIPCAAVKTCHSLIINKTFF